MQQDSLVSRIADNLEATITNEARAPITRKIVDFLRKERNQAENSSHSKKKLLSDERRSIEIFKFLKRIDDKFDNQSPDKWSGLGRFPKNIDSVIDSSEPCELLNSIFNTEEVSYIEKLAGTETYDKEAMWKLLNGAVYLLNLMATLSQNVDRDNHTEENNKKIEQLGQLNMLWSYYATLISRSQERGLTYSMTELANQIPQMLSLDFLPNKDEKDSPLSHRYMFDESFPLEDLHPTLVIQGFYGQLENDLSDWLSDMDMEIEGGYVTPNVFLSVLQTTSTSEISRRLCNLNEYKRKRAK